MNPAIAYRSFSIARAVILIASTYVTFLLFAQFAFLHAVQSCVRETTQIRLIMAAMAVGGLLSSFGIARAVRVGRLRTILSTSFAGCVAMALLTLTTRTPLSLALVSAGIGIFLGALTVSLSAALPLLISLSRRGLVIGLGTGLAYAVCNVPMIFDGTVSRQCLIVAALCGIGAFFAILPPFPSFESSNQERTGEQIPFLSLVILFMILVWLDSAAFAIMQTTPALNQFGWGSEALQWSNGAIHLLVALFAGYWLDRGGKLGVLTGAFACLVSAAHLVNGSHPSASHAHWLYASGVSLYSTALVFVPVSFAQYGCTFVARRAGLLFGVAGWCGSVLGIGMAQDLHTIPLWFTLAAGVVVAVQLFWIRETGWKAMLNSPVSSLAVGGALMVCSDQNFSKETVQSFPSYASSDAAFGREVYIQEGCIHCHSQFPRSEPTREQTEWGPPADVDVISHESPPLIGNRRQGPDLLCLGTRRSPTWNRLHLIDPRSVVPHSRMPSYAHLFDDGNSRGAALVSYLSTLGEGTMVARLENRRGWQPATGADATANEEGAALFHEHCAACHGDSGDGWGRLAGLFGDRPPRDLTLAQWQFISSQETTGQLLVDIARVIKFGIPATSMPGHETLADEQLLSLARYVESLHTTASRR